MPNPVTVTDLEDRWRPLTEVERTRAWALLDDTWAEVLARVGTVEERLQSGTLSADLVRKVVATVVLRAFRDENGYSSETIGPYTYTRPDAYASGSLLLDASDVALLSVAPVSLGGFRSIRVAPWCL